MMIIEELVKVFLVARLAFDIPFFEQVLENFNKRTDMPNIIMIISISMIAYHIFNLVVLWYIYREVKRMGEQTNLSATILILMKYMGVYFTSATTFFTMLIHIYMVEVVYLIFGSDAFLNHYEAQIINLVLIIILTSIILLFELVLSNFFNLNFVNEVLVCSRPSTQKFEYFRLVQHTALIALSLQQNLNDVSRALSLIAIALFAYLQLIRCTYFITYYDQFVNYFNLILKIFKTSYFSALIITVIANLTYKNCIVVYLVIFLSKFGLSFYLRDYFMKNLFRKMINGEVKNSISIERIIYQLLYQCQSKDFHEHKKFLQMILEFEEKDMDEETQSYIKIINEILIHKQSTDSNYHQNERLKLLNKDLESNINKKYEDTSVDFTSITLDQFMHINPGDISVDQRVLSPNLRNGSMMELGGDINQGNFIKSVLDVLSGNYEASNSSLFEIFSNDQVAKKKIGDEHKKEQIFIKVDNQVVDVTSHDDALQYVRNQFLYNVIARKASIMFPDSQTVMFFKAYLTTTLLKNRHLTLTTISHLNTSIEKEGFLKQVESLISQNYFVESSINKYSFPDELDSHQLLQQSIKVDEILKYIKDCTEKIGIFWQLLAQDDISKEQIEDLMRVSYGISIMLKQIKQNLVIMTSVNNFQSSCYSLYYYICHFYNIVIRDHMQSQIILKHMMNVQSLKIQSQSKASLIDEIGLVVVDGNFSLFGQMLFANKTICKLLGYKAEELMTQKIHMLMPELISQVHNKFWNRFSEVGIPKVLEQVRFLFVKDKEGFVSPYKIFIKFMYHKDFGYCFIGLFRRPKSIIYDDQESQVRIKKCHFMICDHSGKIVEISKSCYNLMKIRPEMLEKIHSSLQNNFTIGHLNSQLQLQLMDFNKNNCYFYRYINLNLTIIQKLSKVTEHLEELEQNTTKMRNSYRAQMKIIKEDYGSPQSAQVSLYYMIFSEFNNNQNTMHNISGTSAQQTIRQTLPSINVYDSIESEDETDNLYFNQKEDQAKLYSINNKSMSTESLMNIQNNSISSSYSSSQTSNGANEIKFIEEGIDYEKNPKPLMYLRLAILVLLLICLLLSTIEFVLNVKSNNQNVDYQKMLAKTLQAEEGISALTLFTRNFVNINLGFENKNSTYFQNRQSQIRKQALQLLEDTRIYIKELDHFMNQIKDAESFKNHFSNTTVNVFEIYMNKNIQTLYSRNLSRIYSMNDWLNKIYDIFQQDNFTSKIYTFYPQNFTFTNNDILAFNVFTNSQQELKLKLKQFNYECETFIKNEVEASNFMNQIYVIITSIVVVIITLITQYYLLFLNQFKYQVLNFFAELKKSCILMNEQGALEFSLYLKTDNYEIIRKNEREQREYQIYKTQMNMENSQIEYEQPQTKDIQKSKKKKKSKVANRFLSKLTKKAQGIDASSSQVSDNFEENNENDKDIQKIREEIKEQMSEEHQKGKYSSNNINNLKNKGKGKSKVIESSSSNRLDLNKLSIQSKRNIDMDFGATTDKNQNIILRLKELKMKKLTQMFVIGTLTSFILIIYFVVQHLLFLRSQDNLASNSIVLKEIQESLDCTSMFLYKVREIQISNSSVYLLDNKKSIPLQQVQDMNQINSLNLDYQSCRDHNKNVSIWINKQDNSHFYQNKSNENICTFLRQEDMFDSNLTFQDCNNIYKGVLKQDVLYQTSLFLQDSFQMVIQFGGMKDKSEARIRQSIAQPDLIELIDSVTLYQQFGLRKYFNKIFEELLEQKSTLLFLLSIYIVFAVLLIIGKIFIHCYITPIIRNNFWNAFYILKLLPRDDLDRDFIKRINDFLNKA